jgi:hypothetical protein
MLGQVFPLDIFSFEAFKTAFAVVLSRTTYLPAADLFALVSPHHSEYD